MGEYDESDISYVSGQIDGYLLCRGLHTDEDWSFDEDRWESLYGSKIVLNDLPAYPSTEARKEDRDQLIIVEWEESTETNYLKEDVSFPDDRPGTLVFEDGTVVQSQSGERKMFTLSESETELIEAFAKVRLEVIREVYDYYDRDGK